MFIDFAIMDSHHGVFIMDDSSESIIVIIILTMPKHYYKHIHKLVMFIAIITNDEY